MAHKIWPNAGIRGQASQELPSPKHFEELAAMVRPEDIERSIPCGPDTARIIEGARAAIEAGVTHLYLHQIGPRQSEFLDLARDELLPAIRG